jgi:hypothetical protein
MTQTNSQLSAGCANPAVFATKTTFGTFNLCEECDIDLTQAGYKSHSHRLDAPARCECEHEKHYAPTPLSLNELRAAIADDARYC